MSGDGLSISPEEFVQEFKDLKDYLVSSYFSNESSISRRKKLSAAGLDEKQLELVKCIVDEALTDALYSVLLGLEGTAAISQHHIMYKLFDETSNELTGQLESLAWEQFHGQST
ncbi:hypothetical protein BTA51_05670 [Hahella sp. CCB-MM4]|uniref:hypothetical protein n=1 Tax=Hahella sp. (strain CCB-MM4) TaxID=1926491 RepID=UPI000B9B6AC6|nr:hypothetical protein [Hahella sp. CCB-MM4]OZG74491.1 hypothetical protein BTA51_05670 [Hahella sp. CCB-MM4]